MRATNLIIAGVAAVAALGAGAAYMLTTAPQAPASSPEVADTPTRPSLASTAATDKASAQKVAANEASSEPEPEAPKAKGGIVRGTAASEAIAGTAEADRIYAAEDTDPQGADTIDAGAGDDRIYVDASDVAQGGDGDDELIVRGPKGYALKLAGSGIEAAWGGDGNDDFDAIDVTGPVALRGGLGDDRLRGGTADDALYGGDGDDKLDGGPGDDRIKGEVGTDTITGGSGADAFNYTEFDGSTDIITDYSAKQGDTVTAKSFSVRDKDTWLLDDKGNALFVLKNYDGSVSGIARPK